MLFEISVTHLELIVLTKTNVLYLIQRQRNADISGENIHTKQIVYELQADIFFQPMKRSRRRHFLSTLPENNLKICYRLQNIAILLTERTQPPHPKKIFRARRLFTGCDVTFRWMILTQKCARRRGVFSPAPAKQHKTLAGARVSLGTRA